MKASKIDPYWLHTYEEEYYVDYKIAREDVRFASHKGEEMNSEVTITYIEVNEK